MSKYVNLSRVRSEARWNTLIGTAYLAYLDSFARRLPWDGFRFVEKDMHVFKKVHHGSVECIANLIIPKGSIIYGLPYGSDMQDGRKMRANKAIVHSIVSTNSGDEFKWARSGHDVRFVYKAGEAVKPLENFSTEQNQCRSGIHFFVNLHDALTY